MTNERKTAAPVVETGDGGTGQLVMADVLLSQQHCSAGSGQKQGKISALLLPGAGNAVPLRQLATWTGLAEREVRRVIQRERLAGVPILADNVRGYFLPSSEAERVACARSMRHRAGQILAAADAIESGETWDE